MAACIRRTSDTSSYSSMPSGPTAEKWPMWKVVLAWSAAALAALILLIFILIWVVIPITFWLSIQIQRYMMFIPRNDPPDPVFDQPEYYGIEGVYNFYISVKDYDDNNTITSIGAWLVLHQDDMNMSNSSNNVADIIKNSDKDILLYLHGVAANRAQPVKQYGVLRQHFLIIAIDHRGYGDSGTNVVLSEAAVINDHVQIYDWVRSLNPKNDLYYWGHSLGSALSCHTVRALKEQRNAVPKGLILESAFSTMADVIVTTSIGKLFKWLAWFDATILRPLDNNGFHFRSTSNILSVDCPVMQLHAEDDNVVPYDLGEKLHEVAAKERNLSQQGNATFHGFAAEKGYGHVWCTSDPAVPTYISEFVQTCREFWNNKSS
ncbi:lysophosphatidylserine lipase ABHD12-like [Cylas formicarius]|uniref:lysophosphatidylserine lipase ABHD12-like n=1 Tax=Cylas formicarius TaxID=197179 RepID=UPI002958BF9A|nr:lysophosphatidylserine lipase ABHD12-like [Cylas formicarius]